MSAAVIVLFDPSGAPHNERRNRGRLPKSVGSLHRHRMAAIVKTRDAEEGQHEIDALRKQIANYSAIVEEAKYDLAVMLSRKSQLASRGVAR